MVLCSEKGIATEGSELWLLKFADNKLISSGRRPREENRF